MQKRTKSCNSFDCRRTVLLVASNAKQYFSIGFSSVAVQVYYHAFELAMEAHKKTARLLKMCSNTTHKKRYIIIHK